MKYIKWSCVLCFLFTYAAWAATVTINSLPHAVGNHSEDEYDTLVLNGTKLTTDKYGITFQDDDKWVLLLEDDTLEFGSDTFDSTWQESFFITAFGIKIRSGCSDIVIDGGYILHSPLDTGGVPIDTSTEYYDGFAGRGYNQCIVAKEGGSRITIKNVREAVLRGSGGTNGTAAVIFAQGGADYLVDNCRLFNECTAFDDREDLQTAVIKMTDNSPGSYTNYHLRVTNSYLVSRSHCAIVMYGDSGDFHTDEAFVFQTDACSLKIDTRNDQFTGGPALGDGAANGYGIYARSIGPGSYITDNVFLADSSNNGGRGIFLLFSNGTIDSMIDISGNYVSIHEGSDDEFPTRYYPAAIKLRQWNHFIDIHDNVFVARFDSSDTWGTGRWFMGSVAVIEFGFASVHGNSPPHYINFVNNLCSAIVALPVDDGTTYEVACLKFEAADSLTEFDPTIVVNGNYLYTNGNHAYDFGQFDAASKFILCTNDTVDIDSSETGLLNGTHNVGFYTGSWGHAIRDAVYLNDAVDTSVVNIYQGVPTNNGSNELDIRIQRTVNVVAMGYNELPVPGAACSLFNVLDDLVFAGISASDGSVSGVATHFYSGDPSADTSFNDFTSKAILDADSAMNTAFTVGSTAAGGVDTLVLENTAGEEPTAGVKPVGIRLLGGRVK